MLASLVLVSVATAAFPTDLLPDMIVWQSELNWSVGVTSSSEPPAGRAAIRFDTATANIGNGNLELRGQPSSGATQPVNQRIYRSDATFYDRLAGNMVYHPSHGHIHFENWTAFRLRSVLPGNGVGPVVRQGSKTSFCVLELRTYNSSLPGYNGSPSYGGCGQIQGLRPGRADIYSSGLTDQYIDITGLPEADYWLEGEVDPDNLVLETDETNNAARVLVHVGTPAPPPGDAYEDNDSKAVTDARVEAASNSPNLGLVNALRTISGQTMDDAADWYKFRLNRTGGVDDFVRVSSGSTNGDLDLRLYNDAGTMLAQSTTSTNTETITLNGRPAGTYYAVAVPKSGFNPNYTLTIDPAANRPPTFNFVTPNANQWVESAYETVGVTWYGGDPDGDAKFVSFWLDRTPTTGGTNTPIGGYQNIPGSDYFCNINTAQVALGRWYLQARATDGGAETIKWNPYWFTLYKKGDINYDGWINSFDYIAAEYCESLPQALWPEGWTKILDFDRDNDVDDLDWKEFKTRVGKD